jgi:diguanylate cyclase (GGDEF)-like protein
MNSTASLNEDRSIGRIQRNCAVVLSIMLIVCGAAMTPIANQPLMHIPGYMTAFGAAMVVINFMLAMLLYSRGATEDDGLVVTLGTAYFFVAAIFVPLMASFADGLIPGTIIGTPVSSVWLWTFWHAGFGLLILRFAYSAARAGFSHLRPWREAAIVLVVVLGLTVIATSGLSRLPTLFSDGHRFYSGDAEVIPWTILGIDFLAAVLLSRLPKQTPEQLWLTVGMLAACFDVWLTFHGTDRFSLGWYVSKLGSLFTSMAVLISLFADLTLLYRRAFETNIMLASMAHQDGLTCLANRRKFDETVDLEWRRAKRFAQPLSLLMIDVDFFKKYNDRFGHTEGDDCLRKVALVFRVIAQRPGDLIARYGGEEFAIVLPATTGAGAMDIANQILERLSALALPHPDAQPGYVTVSIGISTLVPDEVQQFEDLIRTADKALYTAKRDGRNCARHADD